MVTDPFIGTAWYNNIAAATGITQEVMDICEDNFENISPNGLVNNSNWNVQFTGASGENYTHTIQVLKGGELSGF